MDINQERARARKTKKLLAALREGSLVGIYKVRLAVDPFVIGERGYRLVHFALNGLAFLAAETAGLEELQAVVRDLEKRQKWSPLNPRSFSHVAFGLLQGAVDIPQELVESIKKMDKENAENKAHCKPTSSPDFDLNAVEKLACQIKDKHLQSLRESL